MGNECLTSHWPVKLRQVKPAGMSRKAIHNYYYYKHHHHHHQYNLCQNWRDFVGAKFY